LLGNGGGLLGEKLLAGGLQNFGWNSVETVEYDDGGVSRRKAQNSLRMMFGKV
jgi:hypothetical protein